MTIIPSSLLLELSYFSSNGEASIVPSKILEEVLSLDHLSAKCSGQVLCEHSYAVHLHAHYHEEGITLIDLISRYCPDASLFITYNSDEVANKIASYLESYSDRGLAAVEFIRVANYGRNIDPLLRTVFDRLLGFPIALHVHTKRSLYFDRGNEWLGDISSCLLQSRDHVLKILKTFQCNPSLGVVMPRPYGGIRHTIGWGSNYEYALSVCKCYAPYLQINHSYPLIFPAGMMFWFRPAALQGLAFAYGRLEGAVPEPLPNDGSVLHAIERLVIFASEAEGYTFAYAFPRSKSVYPIAVFFRPLKVLRSQPHAALYQTINKLQSMCSNAKRYLFKLSRSFC